jgi:Zn-dependent protease with chaperone function
MRIRAWIVSAVLCLGAGGVAMAVAQQPDASATTDASPPAQVITAYRLPPDRLRQAEALYRTRVVLFVVGSAYGLIVMVAVLAFRFGPRIRDLAERISQRRFVQAMVFVPLLLLSIDVLGLPLGMYGHHVRDSFGLSVQGWGSWFWDWTKNEIVSIVVAIPLVWGLYAILRRSPGRWWFYGWLAAIPVILLMTLIKPIFIDPLFNTFESLEAKQPVLVTQLERVMQRGGLSIDRSRMFEMRASDKVTTYNAYVTGIGSTKRVVVWDNTARDMTVPETMFVFGHEQGHYVLNHVLISTAFLFVGLFVAMYLAHRVIGGLLHRYGRRLHIRALGDWASLPLLMLLLGAAFWLFQPIAAGFSRYLEHQADIYGLEAIHGLVPDSPQVAAHAFQKLGEKALAYPDPNPLFVFWTYGHPPIGERVRFSLDYRPWDTNTPTMYVE